MATYRPKRLDEINEVYGKSLEAQRTIRQSSDVIGTDIIDTAADVSAPDTSATGDTPTLADDIPFDADISDIANDFILRFGTPERAAATTRLQEDEAHRAMARASSQSIKAKVKPVAADSARPAIHQSTSPAQAPAEDKKSDDSAESIAVAPPTVRKTSSDKTDLMEDYMRVMSDEDDEGPLFRRRKKDKKRKGKKAHQEIIADDSDAPSTDAPAEDETTEPTTDSTADAPVLLTDKDSDALLDTPAESPAEKADAEDTEDLSDSADTDTDADSTDEDAQLEEPSCEKETAEKGKKKKRHILPKALLSLLLVFLIVLAGAVGAVKLMIAPNTGTLVSDEYYFFTSDADHNFVGVSKGDLVITQKILPKTNDSFVYADKDTQSFVFAKHQSSILGLDGDVLYVAESDDSRATVMRDDVKGVFYKIVPSVGTILSIIGEYYIIIISALLILCLVIILILSLAFKSKNDEEVYGDEEIEVDADEYEDIFSTSSGEKVDLFSEIE